MDDGVDARADIIDESAVGDIADQSRIGTRFNIQADDIMIEYYSFGNAAAYSSRCAGD